MGYVSADKEIYSWTVLSSVLHWTHCQASDIAVAVHGCDTVGPKSTVGVRRVRAQSRVRSEVRNVIANRFHAPGQYHPFSCTQRHHDHSAHPRIRCSLWADYRVSHVPDIPYAKTSLPPLDERPDAGKSMDLKDIQPVGSWDRHLRPAD